MPKIIPIKDLKSTSDISEMCHRTECRVQREPAGEKHQIYEVCSCICKWNRRENYFWNC